METHFYQHDCHIKVEISQIVARCVWKMLTDSRKAEENAVDGRSWTEWRGYILPNCYRVTKCRYSIPTLNRNNRQCNGAMQVHRN